VVEFYLTHFRVISSNFYEESRVTGVLSDGSQHHLNILSQLHAKFFLSTYEMRKSQWIPIKSKFKS
jgi:hypothetical protein